MVACMHRKPACTQFLKTDFARVPGYNFKVQQGILLCAIPIPFPHTSHVLNPPTLVAGNQCVGSQLLLQRQSHSPLPCYMSPHNVHLPHL